jgi:uncharacterized protein (DUF1501 family)
MERRDFLKLASLAGLAVVSGGAIGKANAFDPKSKTLWLLIDAGGGWDPTSLVDPKGALEGEFPNKYPASAIKQAGNIRWAPMDASPDVQQQGIDVSPIDQFFETYHGDLLVLNGVDTATNSHDAGSRNTWSGGLTEGRASLGAMIAATHAKESPMAFVTNGGYDFTGGIVGATRTGNLDAIIDIAFPNRIGFDDRDGQEVEVTYHHSRTAALIQEARKGRYEALSSRQRLPRVKAAMSRLYTARLGQNELAQLTEYLPEEVEDGMVGQAQLAFAAYQAGLCVAANLRAPGGYDSHGNSDVDQTNNYAAYMGQLARVLQLAEDMGIRQNVAIVMGSDFGRTPGYNDGNGKDHWSITSMMMMGYVNGRKIRGDRVVGTTDDGHNPIGLDAASLQPGGTARITPAVLHREIWKLTGVDQNTEIAQLFPLTDPVEMPGLIELE